jgi:hypothetical protein
MCFFLKQAKKCVSKMGTILVDEFKIFNLATGIRTHNVSGDRH